MSTQIPRNHEQCQEHGVVSERLERILKDMDDVKATLKAVLERLGSGNTDIEMLKLRVATLEKLVYGAVGLALVGVAGAIVSLVLKTHG